MNDKIIASATSKEHEHRIRTDKILPPNFPRTVNMEHSKRELTIARELAHALDKLCEEYSLHLSRKEMYIVVSDFLIMKTKDMD